MTPKTYQLPTTTIEALALASAKLNEPKQVIVNKAIIKYLKGVNVPSTKLD